jgi:hypothetical protein
VGEGTAENGRADDGREGPNQKAMRGIAEIALVFIDGIPLRAQAAGNISADRVGQHCHHDQVDAGGNRKCGR